MSDALPETGFEVSIYLQNWRYPGFTVALKKKSPYFYLWNVEDEENKEWIKCTSVNWSGHKLVAIVPYVDNPAVHALVNIE